MKLSLVKANNGSAVMEDRTFQDFEAFEVQEKPIEGSNLIPIEFIGCYAEQRELVVYQNLELNLQWGGTDRVYFSDIETASAYNRAYIVRTDFIIFEIQIHSNQYSIYQIEMSNTRKSFADLLNHSNIQHEYGIAVPVLVKDALRDIIYVLTPIGAVSFSVE
jgi:hypothetical protein